MQTISSEPSALRARLLDRAPGPLIAAIHRLEEVATADLWLAGGAVRDLLLGRPVLDLDLVAEEDAIGLARRAMPDAVLAAHERFRTATIAAGGRRLDLATTRTETYAAPGALPDVFTPASIEEDLRRRDFTVNALALRLTGEPALRGAPSTEGALADVAAGVVRVLHDASFRDDPTRIFRALRYAARLGFAVEPRTRALLDDGVRYIAAVSGERLRHELALLFEEETGDTALEAAETAGVLRAVHPALAWDTRRGEALGWARELALPRVVLGFALLAAGAGPDEAEAIIERLRLTREEAAAARDIAALRAHAATLRRPDAKPSGVVVLLDRYAPAAVAAFAATADDAIAAALARRYLGEWRHVRPTMRGDELVAMGVPEGPQVSRGLQLVRAARLDGWARDAGDERALVARFAKSIRDSAAMNAPIEMRDDE